MWRHNALLFHDASPDTHDLVSDNAACDQIPALVINHLQLSNYNLDTSSTELKYHFTPKKYSYKTVPRSLFPLFPCSQRSKIDPRSKVQGPTGSRNWSLSNRIIHPAIPQNEERIITFSKSQCGSIFHFFISGNAFGMK